ncbi:uncharacterized protein L201_006506 [Kwoniella dendrophila CBS 6074]|uniref:Uncharacterized protein n=1 Tax=Kwoniella dendrophila CBS 6074 TaxID=1295534 RepID=A0AAX4K439_9TREE
MAALRSATATAIAGPGPQTLLYRSKLPLTNRQLISSVDISARCIQTTVIQHAARPHWKANKPKKILSPPPYHLKPEEPAVKQHDPHFMIQPAYNYEEVILLGVPPDYPIDDIVKQLHQGLTSSQLDIAIQAWSKLWDLRCISRLESKDFEVISNCISKILFGKNYPHLGKMSLNESWKFGHLKNMLIESCSRGGYIDGLYSFMLKLIGTGKPQDVIDLFDKLKMRLRELQNKKKEDLFSWDRNKRLHARLALIGEDKDGLKKLLMCTIASHTLLNSLNENVLFELLDTQLDLRPNSYFDFKPIDRALLSSINTNSNPGEDIIKKFRQNVDNLVLSLTCYHPNALVARITSLGTRRSHDQLEKLYDRVLEASIGPNAFLRPKDLNDFNLVFRNIPIPAIIWLQFMKTFEWKSDITRIARMIDNDLPERGLEVNDHFLATAMLSMAIITQRSGQSPTIRSTARAWVNEYWRRLTSKGWHIHDDPFSKRIRCLSILSFIDSKFTREIIGLYDAAKAGHLGRIGDKTRAAFIEFFMKHSSQKAALNKAWEVFEAFPYNIDRIDDSLNISFSVFIRRLSLGPWGNENKLKYYKKSVKYFVDSGFRLQPHILGPLLSIQLDSLSSIPMETIIQLTLDATIDKEAVEPGIQRWTKVLYGLLTKWTHTSQPNLREIQAGLIILKKSKDLIDENKLFGVQRGRLVTMWQSFLTPTIKSNHINAEQRQDFLDLAMDLFPNGGKSNISLSMYFEIISLLFNRSKIKQNKNDKASSFSFDNNDGYGEGWRRWKDLRTIKKDNIHSLFWNKMLILLIKHNKFDWSLELVKDAWNNPTQILKTDPFFLRAKSYGLINKLGLDDKLEIEQIAFLEKQQQDSKNVVIHRRRKEPFAFAEDFASEAYLDEDDVNEVENGENLGSDTDIVSDDFYDNDQKNWDREIDEDM